MKEKVSAGEHPWIDGWETLLRDPKAQATYKASPHPHMASRQRAQDDATAAYLNALRWAISGNVAHAECAARILNGWTNTVKEVAHGPDQPGLGGIPIGSFALAGEVLRTWPGWTEEDQAGFKKMLTEYFYPVCHDFLTRHNGAEDTNYWANWDTCNMLAILAIGVFCDDRAKFDEAVEYFKNGRGMGAIRNAVPFVHPGGLGQWQESGRDQAHVMGGMGLMVQMCQVAWNQGVDLFGHDNNRLLAGAEYTARYTLWKGVPYTFYTNDDRANQYYISQNYHGRLAASHFELVYNHYVIRKGLKAPNVELLAALRRPEPGEVDVFGHGTLAFTLDSTASPLTTTPPPTPREVTATAGIGRVELRWSPSGAYTTRGYQVCRATSPEGPFQVIHSTDLWTTPAFDDTEAEPGKKHFYQVCAINAGGKSGPSTAVSATPTTGEPLALEAGSVSAPGVLHSKAAGGSFLVPAGEGAGNFTGFLQDGDFCITTRLVERKGQVNVTGVALRKPGTSNSNVVALTLGESGGRQVKLRSPGNNNKTHTQGGNDYTWLPVWMRIQRVGEEVTAFQSSDGIEWFAVGKTGTPLPGSMMVGLFASAGDNARPPDKGNSPSALFDHVTLEARPPSPPSSPPRPVVAKAGDETMLLTWTESGGNVVAGVKIEASIDGSPFHEIADLTGSATRFENTGIKEPGSIRYRIRAYNRGGYSPYSEAEP